ncbi:S-layer family protein [Lentilactobacillus otakiensis]|uniref:S-layer family protein n=1 Tax=Lentilactobacillus otakiensis TaxID=481720 RepID=UPI001CBD1C41|nr:S-layer family protein [Lentilactobacillus otakiensis]
MTTAQQNATYKIANPGTANDFKTVTYQQPAWTQYKVGRAITDSTPYANTTFKIDQVGTRTRENDQWVHITATNAATTAPNGWILMSGLTQAQAPIADNAIQINLVDPSNNNNVVKSITVTRNGATKGTNFGYLDGNNWTISSSDRSSILNQIRGALNGTSYGLDNLSTAQIAQIAQTNFGSSTNIAVNKITNIADNAVRINFVKPDSTILKYSDWVKSGATKGANVGYLPSGNTNWALNSTDQANIQSQLVSALSGSGFQLDTTTNALTTAQIDQIARGTFGGQVYISVVPVPATTVSPITPYAFQGINLLSTHQLTGTSSSVIVGTVSLSEKTPQGGYITVTTNATDAIKDKTVVAKVLANYVDKDTALQAVNDAFKAEAQNEYSLANLNFNGFKGVSGASFSASDVMKYLSDNNMTTLTSPTYPVFNQDGTTKSTDSTITYKVSNGDLIPGTFGKPANAYYSYQ